MKKFLLFQTILSLLITLESYCQSSFQKNNSIPEAFVSVNSSQSFSKTALILFPINPILMLENKRFYVGITKEFSLFLYPYGRPAVEYSLIFRETHLNQLRLSYNYDIPVEAGDLAAVMISPGAGYFTDFSKEGFFSQLSFGLLLPVYEKTGADFYIKPRYTIMTKTDESNIFDFSFGIGAYFSF